MKGTTVLIHELSASDKVEMFHLLDAHFMGVSRQQFDADLATKSAAILVHDDQGTLRGFTTAAIYRSLAAGSPVAVLCSGDTITDASARSSTSLGRAWLQTLRPMALSLACPRTVWLLIVSGFRTYRYLPVFWREFTPRTKTHNDHETTLLRALASERFAHLYNPHTGIVRFQIPQQLRPHLADVPAERLDDPHIQFFLQRNPHHAQGDELACLCDLSDDNLTAAGKRLATP